MPLTRLLYMWLVYAIELEALGFPCLFVNGFYEFKIKLYRVDAAQ